MISNQTYFTMLILFQDPTQPNVHQTNTWIQLSDYFVVIIEEIPLIRGLYLWRHSLKLFFYLNLMANEYSDGLWDIQGVGHFHDILKIKKYISVGAL